MALPFLAGVLLKVYDDFVDDEPILTNPYATATLHHLQLVVFAVVASSNFLLCVVFTLFNAAAAWASWAEYSRPHVWSYFCSAPLLLAVSFASRTPLARFDYPIAYGYLAYGLTEPRLYPEETSVFKMVSRGLAGYATLLGGLLFRESISPAMLDLMALSAGYSIASSMGQMLKLTGCIPRA